MSGTAVRMEALPVANLLLRRGGAVALARRRIFIRLSRGRRHPNNGASGWHDGPYGVPIFNWGELMRDPAYEFTEAEWAMIEHAEIDDRRRSHEVEQSWLIDWLDLLLFVGSDVEGEYGRN